VWRKLARVLEGDGRLFEAGVAWRGAADVLFGDGAELAVAEAELARTVTKALQGVVSGRTSASAMSAAPALEGDGGGEKADAWWSDRALLRRVLAGVSAARAARPGHGPTLQLLAAATDKLARVPPHVLAALIEDPSGGSSGRSGRGGAGDAVLGDNDDGEATSAMLLPLGLSPAQVRRLSAKGHSDRHPQSTHEYPASECHFKDDDGVRSTRVWLRPHLDVQNCARARFGYTSTGASDGGGGLARRGGRRVLYSRRAGRAGQRPAGARPRAWREPLGPNPGGCALRRRRRPVRAHNLLAVRLLCFMLLSFLNVSMLSSVFIALRVGRFVWASQL